MTSFSDSTPESVFVQDSTDCTVVQAPIVHVADLIIDQIKAACPIFKNQVAGAATISAFRDDQLGKLPLPSAYVVPLSESVAENTNGIGYKQMVTKTIQVVVIMSNKSDERGQTALAQIDIIKQQLIFALANFFPEKSRQLKGMQYGGYPAVDMNAAQVIAYFTFSYDYQLTNVDVHQPEGYPFENLQIKSTQRNATISSNYSINQSPSN